MTKFAQDLETGDALAPLSFTVTPEWNQQYCYAQEDFDPRYTGTPAEVHPTLLLSMSANTKSPGFKLAPDTGSILSEQLCRFFHPAHVGKRIDVAFRVTRIYTKQEKRFHVVESTVTDEEGTLILKRESHLIFGRAK
ncbi:MAG: hypothetical protein HY323_18690 [Betaproteobacteria bacterium]|nr:hypothetical protein [Betaproteobacteria bacterium]